MPADVRALPEIFGRYRILRPLGQGGMGAVYLAHDEQLDREVALKVPRMGDASETVRERLVREARAAANVRHPNICPVYEIDERDGTLYLAMAYIPGRPLSAYLASGKAVAPRQAALLVRKVALALQAAHERGVIHRDLKPSNIMIDERSEPIVMDFGLARQESSEAARLTQDGTIVGTPAYMAPEQISGDPERVGPASDVYSLGVVFYELLTGQPPFEGPIAAVLSQVLTAVPQPPSQRNASVDPELEAICLRALAKDIEQRYASMRELADALTAWLRAGTGQSGPVPVAAVPSSAETTNIHAQATSGNSPVAAALPGSGNVGHRRKVLLLGVGAIIAVGIAGAIAILDGDPAPPAETVENDKDTGVPSEPNPETGNAEDPIEDGWIPLFDGTDLSGWQSVRHTPKGPVEDADLSGWEVRDGILIRTEGVRSSLYFNRLYSDFVLTFDLRLPVDSGLMIVLRKTLDEKPDLLYIPLTNGMALRKMARRGHPRYMRQFADVPSLMKPAGEWNAIVIQCVGDDVVLHVNEQEAVRFRISDFDGLEKVPRRGVLGVQTGEVAEGAALRNIRVRRVPSS